MKGKIIEAFHNGVPVVTTSIGAQGMDFAANSLMVADDPNKFTDLIETILNDDELWMEISQSERGIVAKYFSFAAMFNVMDKHLP